MMPVEIETAGRHRLAALFADCTHDRVLIDSVLEGCFGRAYADSAVAPTVARLDSAAFTMLAGDARAAGVKGLLRLAPIGYVTPQTGEWRRTLEDEFGPRLRPLPFVAFSAAALDHSHLLRLVRTLPAGFDLKRVDQALAERLPADMGNDCFLENFYSIADFLGRGIGYCIVHHDKIVSAATSMARSRRAIDIEIETLAGYRRRGLATAAGARLVLHSVEQSIEPCWLAANAASERLALKLGYVWGGRYETLAIEELPTYRLLHPDEIEEASALVVRVFDEFVAPEYSAEGVEEFYRYARPEAMRARALGTHLRLIALVQDKIAGLIEMRGRDHVSLLFVAPEYQRRGIARELLRRALESSQPGGPVPAPVAITVHSSSCAAPIYERLGFRLAGERRVENGISYIPMVRQWSDPG